MKRAQLIETGIVVIILVLLYEFIHSLMDLITGLFFLTSNQMPVPMNNIILNLVFPVVLYLFSVYLLAKYKKPLAQFINGKENDETSLVINFSGQQLLHIAIVIITLLVLFNEIPAVISSFIEKFITKSGNAQSINGFAIDNTIRSTALYLSLGKVLFSLLILILSKKIASIWKFENDNSPN
jgi:hypothetical protein